ncbi:MAG TPA: asparagine synthase (glutamine-hydrolyzing) [Polyangiaceae bacterium]|nr:asparagine synthase (glutamine-hydrolyzing) [Polyangiaceae bacterium]
MCGVVGVVGLGGPVGAAERAALGRAIGAIGHRGPDGSGLWADELGGAALGHVRLAIIDPAGGAQPIANEDGTVVASVSGELYGFEALRAGLEARGHRFRTGSDAEVLVHLYEERGPACLDELRGEFAFLLWDARDRLLFAARDRFGVRPLCYAEHGGRLWLASEAKALFAAGLPAAWDETALEQAAQMQYPSPERTLFRGVRALEPGHLLLAAGGAVRTRPYWDLDYPPEAPGQAYDAGEAREAVRAALADAVRVRLRADVPVAFQLSGGVDSAAVVALAASLGQKAPPCFTIGFDDAAYDERAAAGELAAYVGADLHVVDAPAASLVEAFAPAVEQGEGLAINGHIGAKFLLSRAVRDAGYKVVLTGEGADEVFAGYAHLRQDLWASSGGAEGEARLARLAAENRASAGIMLPSGPGLALGEVRARLGFVPSWLEAKASLGLRVGSLLAGREGRARPFDAYRLFLSGVDVGRQLRGRARVHQSLYLWTKTALGGYILRTLGDGMEMAHGVEGRLPFLDHRLFELARSLPVSLTIREGVEKYVLREALGRLVPPSTRARQKHPFLAPPFASVARGLMRDLLRPPHLPAAFDASRVRDLLERFDGLPEGERRAIDPALCLVTSAAILQQRYRL